MHTTNYFDSFIEVAEDCPLKVADIPDDKKDKKTIASMQFEIIAGHPSRYTSDEVLFTIHAARNGIKANERTAEKEKFFSKGQACFRSSPLAKRYGWGVHFDIKGRMAIYAVESQEYKMFADDDLLTHYKAMRSKKAV